MIRRCSLSALVLSGYVAGVYAISYPLFTVTTPSQCWWWAPTMMLWLFYLIGGLVFTVAMLSTIWKWE